MRLKNEKENFFEQKEVGNGKEIFSSIFSSRGLKIKRIISKGYRTPERKWLIDDTDEFVILLKGSASIRFFNGEIKKMKRGDYIHIPPGTKHKVTYTSKKPCCYWLAIHFKR